MHSALPSSVTTATTAITTSRTANPNFSSSDTSDTTTDLSNTYGQASEQHLTVKKRALTRSQLRLPASFNVAFERSPLRDARRANANLNDTQQIKTASSLSSKLAQCIGAETADADVDTERDVTVRTDKEGERTTVGESGTPRVEEAKCERNSLIVQDGLSNTVVANRDRPSTPPPVLKRSRSPAFDDVFDTPSSRSRIAEFSNQASSHASTNLLSGAKALNGAKKPRINNGGTRGPLDAFFTRQVPINTEGTSHTPLRAPGSVRRTVSAGQGISLNTSLFASSSSPSLLSSGSSSNVANMHPIVPPTPTIKQLKAIPSLDLHTMTPSPRKRSGTVGSASAFPPKSPGAALILLPKSPKVGAGPLMPPKSPGMGLRVASEGAPWRSNQTNHTLQGERERVSEGDVQLIETRDSNDLEDKAPSSELSDLTDIPQTSETEQGQATEISDTPRPERRIEAAKVQDSNSRILSGNSPTLDSLPAVTATFTLAPKTPMRPSNSSNDIMTGLTAVFSLSPLTPAPPANSEDLDGYAEEEREIERMEKVESYVPDENPFDMTNEAGPSRAYSETENAPYADQTSNRATLALSTHDLASAPTELQSTDNKLSEVTRKPKVVNTKTVRAAAGKRSKVLPTSIASTATTPRMRLTRAAILRQKQQQERARSATSSPIISKIFKGKGKELGDNVGKKDGKEPATLTSETQTAQLKENKEGVHDAKKPQPRKSIFSIGTSSDKSSANNDSDAQKKRKRFTLTIPSSLSPTKRTSAPSSADTSFASTGSSMPSKPFTFTLYPPEVNDPAMKARSHHTLTSLSSALDKLTMPPPQRPESRSEIRRPSTSLGFTREMSAPAFAVQQDKSRPRPLSRAGSIEPTGRASSVMPPPAVPRFGLGKSRDGPPESRTSLLFGNRTVGGGSRPGFKPVGLFGGRAGPRFKASQKTSLETVQGSPVKGGTSSVFVDGDNNNGNGDEPGDISFSSQSSTGQGRGQTTPTADRSVEEIGAPDSKGRRTMDMSKLSGSRRASMVFSALAQSLNTPESAAGIRSESNEVKQETPRADISGAGQQQQQATPASTSTRPVRTASLRSRHVRAASDVTPLAGSSSMVSESDGEGKSGKKSATGRSKMPGSLDVLSQCTVFVDVRSEEGDDAGALFVDMLRSLGAKVLTRVGQTCTHIVYKNGLASTLTRYRLFDEPRPKIIGIGWVVACAEKREQVDEERYKVNIDNINVAGTLKRRRSVLPKQMPAAGPMDAFVNGGNEVTGGGSGSGGSMGMGPPKAVLNSDDPTDDESDMRSETGTATGTKSSLNYNPLEQAKRRRSFLPRPLGTN